MIQNTDDGVYLELPVITKHPNNNGNIIAVEESTVTLQCEATGEGTLSYEWIRVSGLALEVIMNNDTHLIIPNITVNDSGDYYCKVNNGRTSVSSMKVQVIVRSKLYKIHW